MEEGADPARVTSEAFDEGVGALPLSVALLSAAGGVISATSVSADPVSGVRQFEQVIAPGALLVLQAGQSIAGAHLKSSGPASVSASDFEIKCYGFLCGAFWNVYRTVGSPTCTICERLGSSSVLPSENIEPTKGDWGFELSD